ncbi:Gfo/Idh/MocA family protein [Pseudotabrizicola algicola]|uniref:Gfo/Idh/MocA family oxidoreductase n=1 Tax=Pseudotabrizicola algicola TaxID=2709381 RepID=A0A6B3RPD7_9RHOB|nr:Gfo/Idh/MocA family oxidoreductase [Pseudotabrizicola algicola]NEX46628.1 Gfo/Idh/MocA family oxidoreductase [Pseudotabrizicola algicola]
MTDLRVILVGLGARSRVWRRVLANDPSSRIVGVVDTDAANLAAALAELPDAVGGRALEEVAERVDADAVILITPPGGREAQIAAACAARLAILAEKPLADTFAAAQAHTARAAAAGVPLSVGLNFRYMPVTRALKALFADDRLGQPEIGRFLYERWRDGRQARLNKYPLTMDQPMLWEQSIHHFDLMRFVYGREPVAIAARTWNPSWSMYAGDANVAALISFEGGLEVTYQGTWAANWDHLGFDWRSDCPGGIAVQRDMFGDLAYARRDDKTLTQVDLPHFETWIDDAAGLWAEFAAHLRGAGPLPCPATDHLNSLRMVEACIRAAATGQTITLNAPTVAAEPSGAALDTSNSSPTERMTQ